MFYLHFEQSDMFPGVLDHGLGQHGLYHLIHVIVRFKVLAARNAVVVYHVVFKELAFFKH